jgi:hypothetical protein
MRTEHESDFIDDRTAPHVASVVNCRQDEGSTLMELVQKLKGNHYKNQLKKATTTAKILSRMRRAREMPRNYAYLCHDILKALGLERLGVPGEGLDGLLRGGADRSTGANRAALGR